MKDGVKSVRLEMFERDGHLRVCLAANTDRVAALSFCGNALNDLLTRCLKQGLETVYHKL